jgi:hypothetical protein
MDIYKFLVVVPYLLLVERFKSETSQGITISERVGISEETR